MRRHLCLWQQDNGCDELMFCCELAIVLSIPVRPTRKSSFFIFTCMYEIPVPYVSKARGFTSRNWHLHFSTITCCKIDFRCTIRSSYPLRPWEYGWCKKCMGIYQEISGVCICCICGADVYALLPCKCVWCGGAVCLPQLPSAANTSHTLWSLILLEDRICCPLLLIIIW